MRFVFPTESVTDLGSGPTVLFLHGNPDTRACWDGAIEQLVGEYRCLAPDLPGFGKSAPVPKGYDYSIAAHVEFVEQLLADRNVTDKITVVMHDVGGIPGTGYLGKHPEAVRGAVIANTVFDPKYEWHQMARMWATPVVGEVVMLAMNRLAFRTSMKRDSPFLSDSDIDSIYDGITRRTRKTILKLYRRMTRSDYGAGWEVPIAGALESVPARVVWGDKDKYIGPAFADSFGKARVTHYPEYGHWIPHEAPDVIANAVREFGGSY